VKAESYTISLDKYAMMVMSDSEVREWLASMNIYNVTDEELQRLREGRPPQADKE
jgi:hypothetical protein